jgi:hypothetical protein
MVFLIDLEPYLVIGLGSYLLILTYLANNTTTTWDIANNRLNQWSPNSFKTYDELLTFIEPGKGP